MDWMIGLALIGGLIWWLSKSNGAAEKQKLKPPLVVEEAINEDNPESRQAEKFDGDEPEVRKAMETFERQRKERSDEHAANRRAIVEDERKLEKAKEMIESSHLDIALPYVQDESRHWPSWSKLPDERWAPPIPLIDIDGSTSAETKSWVQFKTRGLLFRIDMQESQMPSIEENEFATMNLSVDGQEVLGMGVIRNCNNEFSRWRFSTVDSFRVGSWLSEFVSIYGDLLSSNERIHEDSMQKYTTERSANIDLGDSGSEP